jgi:hypothetical protein
MGRRSVNRILWQLCDFEIINISNLRGFLYFGGRYTKKINCENKFSSNGKNSPEIRINDFRLCCGS